MDNNFYDVPLERRKSTKPKQQKNFMTRVILTQFALSLIVTGVLFLVCRSDSNLSQNIKSFYTEISKTDIAVSEILGNIKNVAKETFSPNVETEKASGETEGGENAVFSPVFLTVNFQNPIENGNITSKFGYRVSPITNKYSLHTGLDISAPKNTKIYSAYDGIVEKSDYNEINGHYIILSHGNNLKTTYNHCEKLLVEKGEKVSKGEVIALVGETGWATGNHLHFEVILNGNYVNPLYILKNEF